EFDRLIFGKGIGVVAEIARRHQDPFAGAEMIYGSVQVSHRSGRHDAVIAFDLNGILPATNRRRDRDQYIDASVTAGSGDFHLAVLWSEDAIKEIPDESLKVGGVHIREVHDIVDALECFADVHQG